MQGGVQQKNVKKKRESLHYATAGTYLGYFQDHIPFLGLGKGLKGIQTHYMLGLFMDETLLCRNTTLVEGSRMWCEETGGDKKRVQHFMDNVKDILILLETCDLHGF